MTSFKIDTTQRKESNSDNIKCSLAPKASSETLGLSSTCTSPMHQRNGEGLPNSDLPNESLDNTDNENDNTIVRDVILNKDCSSECEKQSADVAGNT